MRAGLLRAATRNQDTNEDESTTTHPLYMENKPGYQPRTLNDVINSEVDRIDMDAIMKNMIQDGSTPGNSNNYENRAILLMAWNAVARGGKVKFNSYSDWTYDSFFKCVDTCWIDVKTVRTDSMGMVPHRDNY